MSLSKHALSFSHLPFAKITKPITDSTLGAIHFNGIGRGYVNTYSDMPKLSLAAKVLQGDELATELWLSTTPPTETNRKGHISYRTNDSYLFGVITLPELNDSADVTGLQLTTEQVYNEIFELMAALDYHYIYRFWNYIADINGISQGVERYWQFNAGRKDAFVRHAVSIGEQYPAACAIGIAEGPLSIAFLLGKHAMPIAIENPRQVSAYDYPEQYGPRPPSFSRATLLKSSSTATLFISGTASIVGHETMHLNDPVAQTQETMVNLQVILDQANQQLDVPLFNLDTLFLRVYVRNALHLPLIQQAMQPHLNSASKTMYIQADICRQDLLLEIEATAQIHLGQS